MGVKWAAELRIEFEMKDGAEHQAETRLRAAVGELKRFIEGGPTGANTNVSRGSAKAAIIKQGPTVYMNRIRIQAQRPVLEPPG